VTFILDIDHSDTKFGLQDESAKRTIQLPIGFDPAEDRIYPLIVKLDILPGAGDELLFWIKSETGDGMVEEFRDGRHTRFLSALNRKIILNTLLEAIKTLLFHCNPKSVILITGQFRLPAKALVKFLKIIEIFENSGYYIDQLDLSLGVSSWLFKFNETFESNSR